MDLTPSTSTIGREDQSWLGSARGTTQAQSVALLVAAFAPTTYAPNGYFSSGIALSKLTSGGNSGLYVPAGTRTVTDGATTNTSATITSATAAFGPGDVGAAISGAGIPAGTTILSVTNATTAVMSANATATATGVSITVLESLSGFLLTAIATPRNSAATVVNGAMIDTGRIIVSKLPVAIGATVQATNPRFVFV